MISSILKRSSPSLGLVRMLGTTELETKGHYQLKISIAPFDDKQVKIKIVKGVVHLTGERGRTTENTRWKHEMDVAFNLPTNIKQDTVKTKIEHAVVIIEAETKSA